MIDYNAEGETPRKEVHMKKTIVFFTVLFLLFLGIGQHAQGAGFLIYEHGAAAMGMALATIEYKDLPKSEFLKKMEESAETLRSTRPTASNLFWAIERIWKIVNSYPDNPSNLSELVIEEAKLMAQEDINVNKNIGKNGASLLEDGDVVLTHCNAGSLATVQYGTALAPVRAAIEQGKNISVIADETRPRLQGARLTAYELQYDKIPVKVISDTSSGLLMRLGKINTVIVAR